MGHIPIMGTVPVIGTHLIQVFLRRGIHCVMCIQAFLVVVVTMLTNLVIDIVFSTEKSKAQRGRWELKAMQLANSNKGCHCRRVSKKAAAKKSDEPRDTLQRHLKNVARGEGIQKKLGQHSIVNVEQEDESVG